MSSFFLVCFLVRESADAHQGQFVMPTCNSAPAAYLLSTHQVMEELEAAIQPIAIISLSSQPSLVRNNEDSILCR